MRRRSSTFGIAAAAVLCTWCAPAATAVEIPALAPITYELAVDWSGARLEGGARVFETDLGYTVGIERLVVGVGVLELVPCPVVTEEPSSTALWQLLGPSSALADHGWDADASRATVDAAELLTDDAIGYAGPATSAGATYCDLFWTIAPVEDTAFDSVGGRAAIAIDGWFVAPGESERQPLTASVALGEGAVVPVSGPWTDGGRVRLTRSPARSFDGLELDALSSSELAFEVIQQLGNTSTAAIVKP